MSLCFSKIHNLYYDIFIIGVTTIQSTSTISQELATAATDLDAEKERRVSLNKRVAHEVQKLGKSSSNIKNLTDEQEERRKKLEVKEQELDLYVRLQHEPTTQNIVGLKVKIAKKKQKN